MEKKTVKSIHLKTDEVLECELNYIQKEQWVWEITLDCEDSKFKAQGKDLFEALKKIRIKSKKYGYIGKWKSRKCYMFTYDARYGGRKKCLYYKI